MFEICKYSHFFKIVNPPSYVVDIITNFSKGFILYSYVKKEKNQPLALGPTKLFATKLRNNSEFRFHLNSFDDFIKYITERRVSGSEYKVISYPLYEAENIYVDLKPEWVPREHQIPFIEHLVTETNTRTRLGALRTGRGKTFSTLAAISQIRKRTVIIIKASYVEKWALDIANILNISPKRIMIIRGSAHLKGLIFMAKNNQLDADFIIISSMTYQEFINTYEAFWYDMESRGYDIKPESFFEVLKAGILLVDEAHLEFHMEFKMLLYTNIPLLIGLTATLVNQDSFLETMYKLVYQPKDRYYEKDVSNYIKATGVAYQFEDINKIKTKARGSAFYSHIAFEKSIMKHKKILQNYMDMIARLVKISYIDEYKEKDKLIIFCSTVKLCSLLTDYLTNKFPTFTTKKYNNGDPYENIIEPSIRVTTILSGGTAIDIPNLRVSILTINILSQQSNIQTVGRLRELKDRDVKFYYLFCNQISKHNQYNRERKDFLKNYVSSMMETRYPFLI